MMNISLLFKCMAIIGFPFALLACGDGDAALKKLDGKSVEIVACDYDPLKNINVLPTNDSKSRLRNSVLFSQAAEEVTTHRDRQGVDVFEAADIQIACMGIVYEAMTPLYKTMVSGAEFSNPDHTVIQTSFGNIYGSLGRVIENGGGNADIVFIKSNADSAYVYGKSAGLIQ